MPVLLPVVLAILLAVSHLVPQQPSERVALPGGPAVRLSYRSGFPAEVKENHGDLYLPAQAAIRSVPVVVVIHGGGWGPRITLDSMRTVSRQLAARGVAVWNIEYRRLGAGGGYPLPLVDVGLAVDHLRQLQRTVAPQLDLGNVTVVGHSAGGQLAAWTAGRTLLPDGAPGAHPLVVPRRVISLSGPVDLALSGTLRQSGARRMMGGPATEVPDRYAVANPLGLTNPAIPALLVHGDADRVVPLSEPRDYVETLRRRGGRATLWVLPGARHADTGVPTSPQWHGIRRMILTAATRGYEAARHERL